MQEVGKFKFNKAKKWTWILIIFAALALSFISLQNINYSRLFEILSSINYFIILFSCIPIVFAALLQSYRWNEAIVFIEDKPNIWALFRSMMIGNAFNNILPKGGELIKPYVYAKRRKLKYSSVLASSVIDRYYDLIGLVVFLLVVMFAKKADLEIAFSGLSINIILILGILVSVGLLLFMIFLLKSNEPDELISKLFKKVPERISSKIIEKLNFFREGLSVVKSPKSHVKMLGWTIIVWIMHTLNLWIAFYAFEFQQVNPLDFIDAIAFLIAISLGITILPIPGGTGVQHYVLKSMLIMMFGINPEEAFAYAAINHACVYFVNLLVGFICLIPEYKILYPKTD
jgi:uncharacterized protein (TIRG00374 family)